MMVVAIAGWEELRYALCEVCCLPYGIGQMDRLIPSESIDLDSSICSISGVVFAMKDHVPCC